MHYARWFGVIHNALDEMKRKQWKKLAHILIKQTFLNAEIFAIEININSVCYSSRAENENDSAPLR